MTVKKSVYVVSVGIKEGSFNITVDANSIEEALQKAKEMKDHEKLSVIDDWNDYNLEITGVFK